MMNWLTGSKHAEARKLINQLKDVSKRGRAEAELLRMGAEAAPALVEALQTTDQSLLPLYQGILVRMGIVTTPALTSTTSYWVRVSNPAGSVDSDPATVTVNQRPTITILKDAAPADGTDFTFTIA